MSSFFKLFLALFKGQIKAHTGQFGEDVIIKKLFEREKKNGFYVDLGAHHPYLHSNTAWFWLNGWSGINVDASQKSIAIFNKIRKNDINLNYAIIPSEQYKKGVRSIELYLPDKATGQGGITATASVHKKTADKRNFTKKQNVDAIDINTLFSIHKITDIDYLNIDVEGLDEEVLLDLDFNKVKIHLISIEDYSFDINPINQSKITTCLLENGYIFKARVGGTSIFVRSESFDSNRAVIKN
jgi:FkbM family methyltransferase